MMAYGASVASAVIQRGALSFLGRYCHAKTKIISGAMIAVSLVSKASANINQLSNRFRLVDPSWLLLRKNKYDAKMKMAASDSFAAEGHATDSTCSGCSRK